MSIVRILAETPETSHPFLADVGMRTLYSHRDDDAAITCFVVRCNVGSEIEEHVHPDEADIIYVLQGKATMWIEDRGEFPLTRVFSLLCLRVSSIGRSTWWRSC